MLKIKTIDCNIIYRDENVAVAALPYQSNHGTMSVQNLFTSLTVSRYYYYVHDVSFAKGGSREAF